MFTRDLEYQTLPVDYRYFMPAENSPSALRLIQFATGYTWTTVQTICGQPSMQPALVRTLNSACNENSDIFGSNLQNRLKSSTEN
jgi:hypothetical protein